MSGLMPAMSEIVASLRLSNLQCLRSWKVLRMSKIDLVTTLYGVLYMAGYPWYLSLPNSRTTFTMAEPLPDLANATQAMQLTSPPTTRHPSNASATSISAVDDDSQSQVVNEVVLHLQKGDIVARAVIFDYFKLPRNCSANVERTKTGAMTKEPGLTEC